MYYTKYFVYLHHQTETTMTPHFNYYPNNITITKITSFEAMKPFHEFAEDYDYDQRLFDQGEDWPKPKKNDADEGDYDNQDEEDFITF